jgi:pimeloyl-ACP methyl ester carboxylesterase
MLESFLTIIYYLVMALILMILCGFWWGEWYSAPTGQDETFYVRADDGWRLAVHHYRPQGGPRGLPVILCHGLSSNRYSFDLPGTLGLAKFLRDRGRDVWVAELRGSGMSDRPGLFRADVPYSWEFEHHLGSDLPAIITRVLELTGATGVHWVGHSMGGLLVLAYLAKHENPRIISAVTVGSPADFTKIHNKAFRTLLNFRGLLEYMPLSPLPFLARLVIPVAHRTSAYLAGPFYPPNTEPLASRKVVALASQLVTSNTIWLNFGRFLESGRFAPKNGKPYLEDLPKSNIPIFVMGGTKDLMAPPASLVAACETGEQTAERKCLIFGKETGCVEDYGHMDLLMGVRAEHEVFPHILTWLDDHEPARDTHAEHSPSQDN